MQKCSKNCYYKAKYCQKHQSFDADIQKIHTHTCMIRRNCHFNLPNDDMHQENVVKWGFFNALCRPSIGELF